MVDSSSARDSFQSISASDRARSTRRAALLPSRAQRRLRSRFRLLSAGARQSPWGRRGFHWLMVWCALSIFRHRGAASPLSWWSAPSWPGAPLAWTSSTRLYSTPYNRASRCTWESGQRPFSACLSSTARLVSSFLACCWLFAGNRRGRLPHRDVPRLPACAAGLHYRAAGGDSR